MSDRNDNIVQLNPNVPRKERQPQLSDAELVEVRRMLKDFEAIATECPTARRLLDRR